MSESAQPASWYSLPNGHGLRGMYMNPGQVNSLIHLEIDSSIVLIQLGEKFFDILSFHASINSCTSQKRSTKAGGFSFVYFIADKIASKCVLLMYCCNRNGAPLYMLRAFVDQNDRQSEPSTVLINTHKPIQRNNSPLSHLDVGLSPSTPCSQGTPLGTILQIAAD